MGDKHSDRPIVSVDMGGTKILAGAVDGAGQILGLAKRATRPESGPEKVVERVVKTIHDAVAAAGLDLKDVASVGVGTPGPLDPDTGMIFNAPNLNMENVPLGKMLKARLELPVFVENDVNIGTLGEYALGAGKGVQDLVGIFVGTGIGGGIILNGELRQGWRKAAAEVGHMILLADGPVCGCGSRGCVEALASRRAIDRDIWAGIQAGRDSLVPELMKRSGRDRLTSGILAEALQEGDTLVAEVMTRAQFYLGLLTASLVNFLDVEMIILGGGVVEAFGDVFLEPIRRTAYQNFTNRRGARDVKIVPARLKDNAVLLGAAIYARQQLQR